MKPTMTLAALLPVAALALAALPAQAQTADPLGVSLTPEGGSSVLPGGTLIYDATFTNTTGSDFLLDNATFSAADPSTAGLLYPLFTGPYTVGLGTSSLTDAFELSVDPSLPPDTLIQGDVTFSGAPLAGGLPSGPRWGGCQRTGAVPDHTGTHGSRTAALRAADAGPDSAGHDRASEDGSIAPVC